jgi:hypothetical protein
MSLRQIRTSAKAVVAFGMLGLLGACADSNTAAPARKLSPRAPANYTMVGTSVVFTVDNSAGAVQVVGSHVISIPAGAICDQATSSYGKTEWDKPCSPLAGSMEITATEFQGPDGEPYIDFQPAMRFSPDKEVMVFFRTPRTDGSMTLNVRYCDADLVCSDEALADASLRPFRVGTTSILGRRVKHFTGYSVVFESECLGVVEPTDDGGLWCEEEPMGDGSASQRRSGYMVASGEDVTEVMPDSPTDGPVITPRRPNGK